MAKGLISVSNLHLITRHEVIELPRRETKLQLSGDGDLLHFKRYLIDFFKISVNRPM